MAQVNPEPGVDAILRDDALLDALGRGELPASYRADVTARLITTWREVLDEPDGLDAFSAEAAPGVVPGEATQHLRPPLLEVADRPAPAEALEDETAQLAAYNGADDRIEEPFRRAFVAAGYARPAEEAQTEELDVALAAFAEGDESGPTAAGVDRPGRHVRRRRLDRIVVATAAAAAVLAAGSAGSVAAASTAQPGDALWPISKVIYADRAHSIIAGQQVHVVLDKAREAAARGDTGTARRLLAEAKEKAKDVRHGSDEEDALQDDLATVAALTDSMPPSPDSTTDGWNPLNPTDQPQRQRQRQRQRQHSGGATTDQQSTGTTTLPAPTQGPEPTKPVPTAESPAPPPDPDPSTQTPTTEPTPEPSTETSAATAPDQQTLTTVESAAPTE
jgi:hypothetical protein